MDKPWYYNEKSLALIVLIRLLDIQVYDVKYIDSVVLQIRGQILVRTKNPPDWRR